ncbi:MAG: efflux RND transporter permease subunit [Bdellovibrionales bacterium]|nr:efflux RND transporter permease subunit [Bdellovibrionales bacterium]MBT3525581.1 efflux RND transporter permease subunit [Bdellovibrionales bacterium]
MKKLTQFFVDNHKLTIVLTAGLLVYGVMALRVMKAESFPNVSLGQATVVTSYEGATAADIETKITKPIEDEIRSVGGLKDVKSISQSGRSTIVVRVDIDDPQVNVKDVMSEIQRAMDRAKRLPSDLREQPVFTEVKSEEMPVIEIALTGINDLRQRDLVADELKEELEDNRSVKSVRLSSYFERAFQIRLNEKEMHNFHISVDEVVRKISSRNTNTPGGELKQSVQQSLVRVEGKINDATELENIVIRSNFSGRTIYLKDIAQIEDGKKEIKTRARLNGKDATILVVTKKAGADTVAMVGAMEGTIARFKQNYPNVMFHTYLDEALKVKKSVGVLANNALTGLILVIVFLFLFLPGKVGFVASISLPLAVIGTMGLMGSLSVNLNRITILALVIALGMLVDNAVVISENFTRLRKLGLKAQEAAIESVRQLWLPVTATAFTTIAAFLPMLVTKGVMGQFIRWIPIIVTMSLLLSLFESFFLLPMRLTMMGNGSAGKDENFNNWFDKFELKFEKFMAVVIKRRYLVGGLFNIIIFGSFAMMFLANKFILFPPDQTEIYVARVEVEEGTRVEETDRLCALLADRVADRLGDLKVDVVARAGISQTRLGDPKNRTGSNIGMLTIYASDFARFNMAHTEYLNLLRKVDTKEFKSVAFEALVNGPPVGNDIEATFRSNNRDELNRAISYVEGEIKKTDGIHNLSLNAVRGASEVFVDIDYVKADRLGLDIKNIGSTIKTAISGRKVVTVILNNKDVDLVLRYNINDRQDVEDLQKIKVLDKRGNLVPLGSFANFRQTDGSLQINRFDFKRSMTLTGNVDDTKITANQANRQLTKIFEHNKKSFPGVTLVFGGVAESTRESMESLFQALVLSLIGIFALLVFLFKSYLRPFIIMTTIPLGLFGFSVAFYFHQRPISFLSLIGIIGLGGIIVNSGIVLISFIDQMRAEGKFSLDEILVKASGMRLRAVLVTSLTTISGLLPTAYGLGGSDAVLIPMTLAMAWGLTSGTILTLIWAPCAYAIIEDINSLVARLLNRKSDVVES